MGSCLLRYSQSCMHAPASATSRGATVPAPWRLGAYAMLKRKASESLGSTLHPHGFCSASPPQGVDQRSMNSISRRQCRPCHCAGARRDVLRYLMRLSSLRSMPPCARSDAIQRSSDSLRSVSDRLSSMARCETTCAIRTRSRGTHLIGAAVAQPRAVSRARGRALAATS